MVQYNPWLLFINLLSNWPYSRPWEISISNIDNTVRRANLNVECHLKWPFSQFLSHTHSYSLPHCCLYLLLLGIGWLLIIYTQYYYSSYLSISGCTRRVLPCSTLSKSVLFFFFYKHRKRIQLFVKFWLNKKLW